MSTRETLRRLWQEHVLWTRLAIISIVHGLPDASATVARLMRNQDQLGQILGGPFNAASAVAALLRQHIAITAQLVTAAKNRDKRKVAVLNAAWRSNADQISAALSRFGYAPTKVLQAMMYDHLNLTLAEAVARIAKDYAKDVATFDRISAQAYIMADMLAGRLE